MVRILAVVALLIAGAAGVAAEENPIVARLQTFTTAYNAADAEAIGAYYTDDAALLPPGSAIVSGRAAIVDHYATAFQQGVSNLRLRVLEIRQAGPATAVEIGETLVGAGDNDIHGRYMHVWVLQDDTWMLSRDMYHVIDVSKTGG